MKRNKRGIIFITSLLTIVVLLILLEGRGKLAFETISQNDFSDYTGETPALFIIAGKEDVNALVDTILAEDSRVIEQLHQLDYDHVFAIMVLQGRKGQGGFKVTVQQIRREDSQVNVQAELATPSPGSLNPQVFTSPYHLVVIRKEENWGQSIQFVLIVDGEMLMRTTRLIP